LKTVITIDGNAIRDIPSFYDELNRVFMAGEDWTLGPSLDALNDVLYGGYGPIKGDEPVMLVWTAMEKTRAALGFDVMRAFYRNKLQHPEMYDQELIGQALAELENGTGATYFEIVLQIIAEHPNIELVAR
jgi:RNAse (barnase) inhibitor barstar